MKRKSPKLVVGKKTFDNSNPFFIAEIGNNHLGKFDLCIKMIDEAKMAGANAVKLQKRNNKKLFTKKNLMKFTIAKIPLEKRMEFIEKNLSLIKKSTSS